MLIDVDQFKQFNDRHGHIAGDCALRAVAACMRGALRPTDMLARYGGEEFAVLLPGAALHHARDIAERVRSGVGHMPIHDADGSQLPSVTVSIGVAQMPEDATPTGFNDRADRAMYRAKSAGRNRVQA
jgi:diguanylate cyclase (GGDEF)-like protein